MITFIITRILTLASSRAALTVLIATGFIALSAPAHANSCTTNGKSYGLGQIIFSLHHQAHLYCAGGGTWQYLYNSGRSGEGEAEAPPDADTLADLECTTDQIAKYDGSAWICTDMPEAGGGAGNACDPVNVQTFTTVGTHTWTKPDCGSMVKVECWGGGGGGGRWSSNLAGGGGGGAYNSAILSIVQLAATETVTVASGGAGATGNSSGQTGGNSNFGAHVAAYGGAGGMAYGGTSGASGGHGGGRTSAATLMNSGGPAGVLTYESPIRDSYFGGGSGGMSNTAQAGGSSLYGGGGGSGGGSGRPGGNSGYGGGGGGGNNATTPGGRSGYGGDGGAGSASAGTAGSQPGGGGGGGRSGAGGNGGDGKCVVTVW